MSVADNSESDFRKGRERKDFSNSDLLYLRNNDLKKFIFRWVDYKPMGTTIPGTRLMACKVPLKLVSSF